MSNKVLTLIFLVLLVIYTGTRLFKDSGEQSFDKVFTVIDTSIVDQIIVYPKLGEESYRIDRTPSGWRASQGSISSNANNSSVQSMLRALSRIEIQRLIAKSEEKWTDYEVDEKNGVRIEVKSGTKTLEDIIVGRFNFNQQTRSATSYIRRNGEDDIYALDGFLSMSLNQGFDALRDKTILDINREELSTIQIEGIDFSKTLSKNGSIWYGEDGTTIDSTRITQYLNSVLKTNGSDIDDAVNVNQLESIGKIGFNEMNQIKSEVVFFKNEDQITITSSINPEVIFSSDSSGVYKRLWTDLIDIVKG